MDTALESKEEDKPANPSDGSFELLPSRLFTFSGPLTKCLEEDDEILYDLAELFRVFGDSTRIKILYALFESELCVNDIAQVVGISQSAVSHQLRVLKTSKLVKFRRDGKAIYYSLDDDHVRSMISLGMDHVEE